MSFPIWRYEFTKDPHLLVYRFDPPPARRVGEPPNCLPKSMQMGYRTFAATFAVTNALGRNNVGGIKYDVEEIELTEGFSLPSSEERLLPLVPSIGIRWIFLGTE